MKFFWAVAVPVLFVAVLGCKPKTPTIRAGDPVVSTGRLDFSQYSVPWVDVQVQQLTNEVAALREQIIELRLQLRSLQSRERWASLDFKTPAYRKLETSVGPLLVSTKQATPYLDGFKIDIELGNPYNLLYSGFTLTASWPEFNTNKAPWEITNLISSEEYVKDLTPGSWNPLQFTVRPAVIQQLEEVSIQIEPNRVSLRMPR